MGLPQLPEDREEADDSKPKGKVDGKETDNEEDHEKLRKEAEMNREKGDRKTGLGQPKDSSGKSTGGEEIQQSKSKGVPSGGSGGDKGGDKDDDSGDQGKGRPRNRSKKAGKKGSTKKGKEDEEESDKEDYKFSYLYKKPNRPKVPKKSKKKSRKGRRSSSESSPSSSSSSSDTDSSDDEVYVGRKYVDPRKPAPAPAFAPSGVPPELKQLWELAIPAKLHINTSRLTLKKYKVTIGSLRTFLKDNELDEMSLRDVAFGTIMVTLLETKIIPPNNDSATAEDATPVPPGSFAKTEEITRWKKGAKLMAITTIFVLSSGAQNDNIK
ncbi:unnamed protein product [Cuscuta europaea]|uniref:Uncharacterized protein n=1 Tax=Cuscuta europaea TaxID=41803 RepID=A0A9P1EMA4_CUSEU|nr:unnamed protein product [Cuscuta europaea]